MTLTSHTAQAAQMNKSLKRRTLYAAMSVSAHPSKIVYWTNSENPSKNHSLLLSYQSQVTAHWDFKDPLLFSRCPSHNKDKIVAPTLTHKVPPHTHTIALGFLFKLVRREVSPPALAQQIPNTVRPSQWSENVTFLNVGSIYVMRGCCPPHLPPPIG